MDPVRIPLSVHQRAMLDEFGQQERQIQANRNLFVTAIVAGVMKPRPGVPLAVEDGCLVVPDDGESDGR